MTFTAILDERQTIKVDGVTGAVTISQSVSASGIPQLTFNSWSSGVVVATTGPFDVPDSFAAVDMPANAILQISPELADGKAFTGFGTVEVIADTATTLSNKVLRVNAIQLKAGTDYTLNFQQALIARIGTDGTKGTLTSSGAITIKDAPTNADFTRITTDSGDSILLTSGLNYTLRSDQAKIAKVGTTSTARLGDFTLSGAITVKAIPSTTPTDLSGLVIKTDGTQQFLVCAGQDYVLTLAQAAWTKVGGTGAFLDLTLAGNVTVTCPVAADLSSTKVKGIDILQLAPATAYTLTAAQAAYAKIGPNGALGNLAQNNGTTAVSGAVMTIKAGATADLTNLVTDSNDIIILDPLQTSYTLNSSQVMRAQVSGSTAFGDFSKAKTVIVKADTAGNEDLSTKLSSALAIDTIQLTAGKDYILTSAQAVMSRVETSSTYGDLALAGNITLMAGKSGEDLTLPEVVALNGVDLIQLTNGKTYTLTSSQAKIAKLDSAGTKGALANTGLINVIANGPSGSTEDLTSLSLDSNDTIILAARQSYTLTALEASISTVKGSSAGVGVLSKAGMTTVIANPLGEDIGTLYPKVAVSSILLSPGQKYSLTSDQAATASYGTFGGTVSNKGSLENNGVLTIIASATSEDLMNKLAAVTGFDVIQLTAGGAYTLSSTQAQFTKVGTSGATGDLSKAANIILWADSINTNLTNISLPTGANTTTIVLLDNQPYTLTAAQAIVAKMGSTSATAGSIISGGSITIYAGTQSDLTGIQIDSGDTIVLNPSQNYTLTSAQAAVAKVGTSGIPGDLGKAGVVTIKAVPGEDLIQTLSSYTGSDAIKGVDAIVLPGGTGVSYTLAPTQLAISTMASATVKASVTVIAKTSADLSVFFDSAKYITPDAIYLQNGQDYTLTSTQAKIAGVAAGFSAGYINNASSAGALGTAGVITIKPTVTGTAAKVGENLALPAWSVSGVDFFQLEAGVPYTITADQAAKTKVGPTGTPGNLVGSSTTKIVAANDFNLSSLQTDPSNIFQLSAGQTYTLTATQATKATIGTGTTLTLVGLGNNTIIDARAGSTQVVNLSTLLTDSKVSFLLSPAQKYTMTTSQAANSQVVTGTGYGAAGDLTMAGAITLIASSTGSVEDLTGLDTNKNDVIQLTGSQSYKLTAAQAAISQIKAGTNLSNLGVLTTSTGTITVLADGVAVTDLTGLQLNPTKPNVIILSSEKSYTLTKDQIALSKVDASGSLGDLGNTTITLKAATNTATAQDLSTLESPSIIAYQLSVGQSYVMTPGQAKISTVGTASAGDLAKAGVITIQASAVSDDLFAKLKDVKGVDLINLSLTGDYTITASQLALVKMTGTGATTGALTVYANSGADLSATLKSITFDSNDAIYLAAGQNYTLSLAQAKVASIASWNADAPVANALGNKGMLTGGGIITVVVNSGEDLSAASLNGVNNYQLTAGGNYTLTAEQAQIAKIGSGGSLKDFTGGGVIKITTANTTTGMDLTALKTDTGDLIQLKDGLPFTITAAQALISSIGTGALKALSGNGVITVDARGSAVTDLTSLSLDYSGNTADQILLATGQKLTMTTAEAAISRVGSLGGAKGDLATAGAITLKANPLGEDLSASLIVENPLDVIQLNNAATYYTLTASQALTAQVITTNSAGAVVGSSAIRNFQTAGALNVSVPIKVVADGVSVTDLTSLSFKSTDSIILSSGKSYTLTSAEAKIAKFMTGGSAGIFGATDGANVTLKSTMGEDLSTLAASGIRTYQLTAGQSYTLAPAQLQQTINVGSAGNLTAAGIVTIKADTSQDLSAMPMLGLDVIQLTSGQIYTLTPSQALMAKIGSSGTVGALKDLTGVTTALTIDATALPNAGDLSGIGTDSTDTIWLNASSAYSLTSAQAYRAKVPDASTPLGALNGNVTIKALVSEDLSTLTVTGIQDIKLGSGQNYTLTSDQIKISSVVGTATLRDLTKAGVITLKANSSTTGEDLTLDSLPSVAGIDQILLTAGVSYTLTDKQAAIAKMVSGSGVNTTTSLAGNLGSTGAITINATAATSVSGIIPATDLTGLTLDAGDKIVLASGGNYLLNKKQVGMASMDGSTLSHGSDTKVTLKAEINGDLALESLDTRNIDSILLASGKDYTLSPSQAVIASVSGVGLKGDLSKAGTIKVAAISSVDLSGVTGIDVLTLKAGSSYILNSAELKTAVIADTTSLAHISTTIICLRANVSGQDISGMSMAMVDQIILTSGKSYTITAAQAAVANVDGGTNKVLGSVGGAVTVKVASNYDLSYLSDVTGVTTLELSASSNYTLTPAQAAISRVGASGVLKNLSSAGTITVTASTDADLSDIVGIDALTLTAGTSNASKTYTLNSAEVAVAVIGTSSSLLHGTSTKVVVKASSLGEDLTGLTIGNIDSIILTIDKDYVLTLAEARIAQLGSGGTPKALASSGIVTVAVANNAELILLNSDVAAATSKLTGVDRLQLSTGVDYTLTPDQALISKVGSGGTLKDLSQAGVITVNATDNADLTSVTGIDVLQLTTGKNYTLTPDEAKVAKFGASGATGTLTDSGTVTVLATDTVDLTSLTGIDVLQLTTGKNYTLTPDEAKVAKFGASGATGTLTDSGIVTVKSTDSADLSMVTGIDVIQLTSGKNYTLTTDEASKAKVGDLGTTGILLTTGTVTLLLGSTVPTGSLPASGVDLLALKLTDSTFSLLACAPNGSGTTYAQFTALSPKAGTTFTGYTIDGTSSSAVDGTGEWKFDSTTHVLSVWDGTAVQSIVLAGVTSVAVTTTGIFTIT